MSEKLPGGIQTGQWERFPPVAPISKNRNSLAERACGISTARIRGEVRKGAPRMRFRLSEFYLE